MVQAKLFLMQKLFQNVIIQGLKFPWHPPSVPSLEESSGINDTPTVVVLADGLSEEAAEAIRTELTPVADKAKVRAPIENCAQRLC